MSYLTGFKTAPFELYSTTTASGTVVNSDASLATMVGSKFTTGDGREFVLVQNGAAALIAGNVIQSPAVVSANFVGLSPATTSTTGYAASLGPIAAAIGGKVIQLATGATAVLANEFAGGYINVVESTGLGQTMKISSNTAASTTSAFSVVLEDPFTTATASTSRYTLTLNPYGSKNGTALTTHGVIVVPATTMTGVPIGVTCYPIPASTSTVLSYGFIQTKGFCAVAAGATVALGLDVGVPDDTAGQVLTYAVASGSRVGTVVVASADAKHNMINVQL
jgi:hypothetical protein